MSASTTPREGHRVAPGPNTDAESDWLDRHDWLTVLAPMIAMLAVGLWGLNRGSMWQDEQVSLEVAQRTIPQILEMVRHVDAVHATFYLLLHVWMLAGHGEVWLRVLPLLAAVCAAGMVGAIGSRLASARSGMIAGLLFAAMPFVSYYAQEGRSYALTCACVLLATYCLVRAVPSVRPGWWIGYGAAAAFAIMLHEFAVLAVAAHGVSLLWTRVRWSQWRRCGVCVGVCAIVVAPLAWVSHRQSAHVDWLTAPTWDTVTELVKLQLGSNIAVSTAVFGFALIGGLAPTRGPGPIQTRALAVPLLLLPPITLFLASLWQPLYHPRYVFYTAAAVPLLVASGIERVGLFAGPRRATLSWLIGGLMVALVFVGQLTEHQEIRTIASRNNDLAGVARVIQENARQGDGVVFMPSRYRSAALAYPDAFAAVHDVAIDKNQIQAANLRGTDKSRSAVRTAMLAEDRIWAIGRSRLRVRANEPGALNEQAVLRHYFTKQTCTGVHGQEVCLFVRKVG